jgi:hypothetical protein
MIAIDLQCINEHVFEGWFEDNRAYNLQEKKGLIACPVCDTTAVTRIPSTFAIKSSGSPRQLSKEQRDVIQMGKKIVDYVEKNFDDVGCDFTKEALKMHYGVEEPRNIRGVSTDEEEKTLKEEGIEFHKFPLPVRSDTDTDA